VEFFGADESGKVHGPRRDVLFVNEGNNIGFETFTQLEIRTRRTIWVDSNPVSEYWMYTDVLPNNPDAEMVTVTYRDNSALSPDIVKSIEAKRGNARFWKVYGLGELGDAGERIYCDWQIIDEIPHEARLERYGLDFGYTNDPTAIVAVHRYDGGFILDEACYRTGMPNREIADMLANLPASLVVADSAEPKSIDEIAERGISIVPAEKGAGSVNAGIQFAQDQRISVTKRSVNLIKEYRNYMWDKDRDGKVLNVPASGWDHCCDALRYALASMKSPDPGNATVTMPSSVGAYRYGASRMAGIRNGFAP
jgi:phage terminase large subunit